MDIESQPMTIIDVSHVRDYGDQAIITETTVGDVIARFAAKDPQPVFCPHAKIRCRHLPESCPGDGKCPERICGGVTLCEKPDPKKRKYGVTQSEAEAETEDDDATDIEDEKSEEKAPAKSKESKQRRKRAKVDFQLPPATPWQTTEISKYTFEVNHTGTVRRHHSDPFSFTSTRNIPFPASISIRNVRQNVKRAEEIKQLLADGRTAKARMAQVSGAIVLKFGRTVADDLKYLPEFEAKQQREREQTKEDESRSKQRAELHRRFKEQPYIGAETEMLALMSSEEYARYRVLKEQAIYNALNEAMFGW